MNLTVKRTIYCLFLWLGLQAGWADPVLKVTMINVHHGDSILIETPGGKNILIDAGKNGEGERIVSLLKSKGISKLDTLILTHHHGDHYGGMSTVVDSMPIGEFLDTDSSPKSYKTLRGKIDQKHINRHVPKVDEVYDWGGGAQAKVISTYDPKFLGTDGLNDNSIVVKLTYKNNSFLLTGDLEGEGERHLLARNADLKADVLKAGHHGGEFSGNPEFIRAVDPKFVLISSGGPAFLCPLAVERFRIFGANLFRTDINGDIELTSDGQNISAKVQKSDLPVSCMDYRSKQKPGDGRHERKSKRGDYPAAISTVVNGKFNGPFATFWGPNRYNMKANYKNDRFDGPYEHFGSNGKPKITMTFADGKLTGPVKVFGSNNKILAEGEAKDDQFISSKIYYDNGKLFKEVTFNNDKPVSIKEYAQDGSPISSTQNALTEVKKLEPSPQVKDSSESDSEPAGDDQSQDK